MPKRIFEQSPVTLNGHLVSCDIESLELMTGRREAVDVTGLCDTYDQFLTPNIRRWAVRLNYFVNYDASSSSATGIITALKGIFDSTASSGVTLTVRATTADRGATNPEWTGLVGIDGDFMPHAGAVAEAAKGSVTLKGMGNLTWYTCSS